MSRFKVDCFEYAAEIGLELLEKAAATSLREVLNFSGTNKQLRGIYNKYKMHLLRTFLSHRSKTVVGVAYIFALLARFNNKPDNFTRTFIGTSGHSIKKAYMKACAGLDDEDSENFELLAEVHRIIALIEHAADLWRNNHPRCRYTAVTVDPIAYGTELVELCAEQHLLTQSEKMTRDEAAHAIAFMLLYQFDKIMDIPEMEENARDGDTETCILYAILHDAEEAIAEALHSVAVMPVKDIGSDYEPSNIHSPDKSSGCRGFPSTHSRIRLVVSDTPYLAL